MSEASALDTVSVKAGSRIGLCSEADPCATVFPYATVWDTICLLVYIAYVCTLVIVGPNEDHNNEDNDNEDNDNKDNTDHFQDTSGCLSGSANHS